VLAKLLAVEHRTTPRTNRFRLRKATTADFNWAVESRGQAVSPPKTTGTVKGFGEDLKPVAGDDAGGMFVELTAGRYERPIVYLSSEGETSVAAASARELFGLLPYCGGDGWDFMDAIGAVGRDMLALDVEKAERNHRSVVEQPRGTIDDEVVQLLAAADVPTVTDPLATIEAANRSFLWAFIDRLDTIITGFAAHHTWFDAWNAPGADMASARAFSPKERFSVGERLTYQLRADAPPRRGIVLGHPQPNRVLIADRSLVVLRAYT
jgi:hypothetical protein